MEIEKYGLSEKQYRFVQLFVASFNASQSAVDAGYSKGMGTALLSRPNIADAIQDLAEEISDQNIMSAKETIEEMSLMAKTTLGDIYEFPSGSNPVLKDITDETAGAIQQLELTSEGHVKSIKMYNRQEALDKMSRIHGLYTVKHEHSGPRGGAIEVNHKYENLDELMEKMDEIIAKRPKQVEVIDID
jgi:phage terminase small subunit